MDEALRAQKHESWLKLSDVRSILRKAKPCSARALDDQSTATHALDSGAAMLSVLTANFEQSAIRNYGRALLESLSIV